MSVVVTTAVVLLLALWGLAIFNRLVRLKNRVRQDWKHVDRQLKRRHALAASLIDLVKGSAAIEEGLVEALIAAQSRAARVRGPVEASAGETALTEALHRVLPGLGRDPVLAARVHVPDVTAPIEAVESEIAATGSVYNTTAAAYNAALQRLPNNIVAGLGSFPKAELFQPASPRLAGGARA